MVAEAGVPEGELALEFTVTGLATCAGVELAPTADRSVVALTGSKVGACAGKPA